MQHKIAFTPAVTKSDASNGSITVRRSSSADFTEEARLLCPETKSSYYIKDEELHASQQLQTVHHKAFYRASKMEAGRESSENVNGRSTGRLRKSMGEMHSQNLFLFATEMKEAKCGVRKVLKSTTESAQKASCGACHKENQNVSERSFEAGFCSMGDAESRQQLTNSMTASAGNSKLTESSLYQVRVDYRIYKSVLKSFCCHRSGDEFFLDAKRTSYRFSEDFSYSH